MEMLLVLALTLCVLMGAQSWYRFYPASQSAATTASGGPATDLSPLCALAISPDQTEAAAMGLDGMIHFYDLQTRTCYGEAGNKYGESRALCYSADEQRLLVCTVEGAIELWSLTEDRLTAHNRHAHTEEVSCCLFSPDSRCFLTCDAERRCCLWDTETLQVLFEFPRASAVIRQACFTADGTQLLTGDAKGWVQHWNLSTQTLIQTLQVSPINDLYKSNVVGLALLPKTSQLLVATRRDGLSIWDLKTGSLQRRFLNQGRELISSSLSADGQQVVSGSVDGRIDVWDVATGKCRQTFAGHQGPVEEVKWTKDQKMIVSAGWDGHLKFWEPETAHSR